MGALLSLVVEVREHTPKRSEIRERSAPMSFLIELLFPVSAEVVLALCLLLFVAEIMSDLRMYNSK